MAQEIDTQIRKLVRKWMGDTVDVDNYTHEEFLDICNSLKQKEEEYVKDGIKYNSPSEVRIHRYVIDNILNPLIGKLEYGKRN